MKRLIATLLISVSGLFNHVLVSDITTDSQMQEIMPIPREIPNLLFYLQRDPDSNTVCYTLNLDQNGTVNSRNPIKIFWVQYAKNGEHKELNYLQRKLAYGIKVHPQGKDFYKVISLAYPQQPLSLRKDEKNTFHVYISIDGMDCILNRVFIRIVGGSALSPHVKYIEWVGTELESGKIITERINIS